MVNTCDNFGTKSVSERKIVAWDIAVSLRMTGRDAVANFIRERMKWTKWAGHCEMHSLVAN